MSPTSHSIPRYAPISAASSSGVCEISSPKLLSIPIPTEALADGARNGSLTIRLSVDTALPGGLAIYGSEFGRYPVDPTVLFEDTMALLTVTLFVPFNT